MFRYFLELNSTSKKDCKLNSLLLLTSLFHSFKQQSGGFLHLAIKHLVTFLEINYFLFCAWTAKGHNKKRSTTSSAWIYFRPEKLSALFKHKVRIICQGLYKLFFLFGSF